MIQSLVAVLDVLIVVVVAAVVVVVVAVAVAVVVVVVVVPAAVAAVVVVVMPPLMLPPLGNPTVLLEDAIPQKPCHSKSQARGANWYRISMTCHKPSRIQK